MLATPGWWRYDDCMVARRPSPGALQKLSAKERAWLEARLREYRRLLKYLREH